ncbi:RNA-binding S4 domain-containing protein [Paracoccus alkenifer]|uniref:Ribosome-associated heat shock protein Hsp15 n=1 Tax=Paracoccus alkenifer TaxID=65735 RepID=A0A1H6LAU2_9RHOB|nr:RNA-binding S4 domain-containing protein [Paracoccus alkenifer]SEH82438.1 ribosome-associated heat shock protein Hsp15 [Paracoccus alkenifer]
MARRGGRPGKGEPPEPSDAIRLDRWLFHVRAFKSRTLAAERIAAGGVRLNGAPCRKPGHEVRPGDVVTVAAPSGVRSLLVLAPGLRRGPAAEAQTLFKDLDRDDPARDDLDRDDGAHDSHAPETGGPA